jgi:hypothetical protein
MRHLLADGWRSLGSAPILGRVCARHLGAGATSLGFHTAVILSLLVSSLVVARSGALGAAAKRTRAMVLFSASQSANSNALAQNERPSAKPLMQAGKETGPAKVGIELKPGQSTLAFPGGNFTFDVAKLASRGTALFPFLTRTLSFNVDERHEKKRDHRLVNPFAPPSSDTMREPPLVMTEADLQHLVDESWSRRERWVPFQRIRALADLHNPDVGQMPVLLREYVSQNVLQPYIETRMRDPRVWTQLGLAADHELFLDFIADYVSRHPGTKGSIELLFLLDTLVQSSLDTLQVLMEITPDRDLQWTRRMNASAFETLVKTRDYYLAQRKRLGLDSYRGVERYYDQIRTQILTTIVRTAPDGYRVDDARYLLGELSWRRGRLLEARRVWGQMQADPHGRYAASSSALLLTLRDAQSRRQAAPPPDPRPWMKSNGYDEVEVHAINAIIEGEYQRWVSASTARLQKFGYAPDSF